VPCARVRDRAINVFVFPDDAPGTCERLGFDPLPPEYADQAPRFAAVRDALVPHVSDVGCTPYADARRIAEEALQAQGLDGWEVARDHATLPDDESCTRYWAFDYQQRLVFLFGGS
jgi:hypothetical protein